jgi:nitrous oxidase accessory protein NosD
LGSRTAAVLAVATLSLAAAPSTRAETTECTVIASAPVTITVQGVYCLKGDLSTNLAIGPAIDVAANNVIIDLNGWKLGNLAAGPSTAAYGIQVTSRQNVTIRNGTIRGFLVGAVLFGAPPSGGHVIEDVRFDGNTQKAIWASSNRLILRRNLVFETGGTTSSMVVANAYGIHVEFSTGVRILDNEIDGVHGAGGATAARGILIHSGEAVVTGNTVSSVRDGVVADIGIAFVNDARGVVQDNRVLAGGGGGTAIEATDARVICGANRAVGYTTAASCASITGNVAITVP